MKYPLFLLYIAFCLVGCGKSTGEPDTKAKLIGRWEMVTKTKVITFKDGRPPSTASFTLGPNEYTALFQNDFVEFRQDGLPLYSGAYTFNGKTITYPNPYTRTHTVTTLTDNTLVITNTFDDTAAQRAETDTYTRKNQR